MSDATLRAVAWLAFAVHLGAGAAVVRHRAPAELLVVLNLLAGAAVLAYWGRRWFGYLFRGITWFAADQLVPAYALLVCSLAVLALAGKYQGAGVHWLVFGLNTLVLLAAALFFSFFRMNRLF